MKKVLVIDTSDREVTKVGLKIDGKVSFSEGKRVSSQVLLPLIDKILTKNRLRPSDLTEIKVNVGPGSFTGLRVGVAVANALGWALKIPVNGKEQVIPIYE